MVVSTEKISNKIVLSAILIALGVTISPFMYIPFLTAKAYPGQHMVNAIAGVLLGPLWAALIATVVGIIRNAMGVGTIYAFPGGISGGVVVGVFAHIIRKIKPEIVYYAALSEPLGTVFIGGTLSVYMVAPLIGDLKVSGALIPIWSLFALSSIPGSVMGFIVLKVLRIASRYSAAKHS